MKDRGKNRREKRPSSSTEPPTVANLDPARCFFFPLTEISSVSLKWCEGHQRGASPSVMWRPDKKIKPSWCDNLVRKLKTVFFLFRRGWVSLDAPAGGQQPADAGHLHHPHRKRSGEFEEIRDRQSLPEAWKSCQRRRLLCGECPTEALLSQWWRFKWETRRL